jgi:cyanosortase A-associated protein
MHRFGQTSIRFFSKLDLRTLLLLVACSVLASIIARFLFSPASANRQVSAYTFPATVELPSWQFVESHPLPQEFLKLKSQRREEVIEWIRHALPQAFLELTPDTREAEPQKDFVLSGRAYRYQRGNFTLNIEMRYVIYSIGDLEEYYEGLWRSPSEPLTNNLRHSQEQGYYAVFKRGDVAYLTACINPRGGSTVTDEQYVYNRRMLDSRPEYWLPWLLGNHSMRDFRCLWTELSLTTPNLDSHTFVMLEDLWGFWYRHWKRQFPAL